MHNANKRTTWKKKKEQRNINDKAERRKEKTYAYMEAYMELAPHPGTPVDTK